MNFNVRKGEKIGIYTYQLLRKYGDFEALGIAKKIGADAVDFDLCQSDNDFRNIN